MKLPTLGGAGGESRGKNGAEIDQTGWKRASFSGDKRGVSVRLWVLSYYIEGVEGRH